MTPIWTDKEVSDLKENYPKVSWDELLNLIPKRTKGAIKKKASELQLKKNTNVKWTKEEENCVEDYLKGKIEFHRLRALLPNRSTQSINLRGREVSKKLDIGFCRYCGKFSSGDSQELNTHRLQCIKNPKSDNYVKPYGFDVAMNYAKKHSGLLDEFADLSGILFGYSTKEVADYCLEERLKKYDLIK